MESLENCLNAGKVILGTFCQIIIKCGAWRKFSPKAGKWLTPTIKDKNVACSNSSIKLWKERKYGNELKLVKSYKKGLEFLVAKTLKFVICLNCKVFTESLGMCNVCKLHKHYRHHVQFYFQHIFSTL